MRGREGLPVQIGLAEAGKENITVYEVPAGTVIYPVRSGRGVVQESFLADATGRKAKGLNEYRVRPDQDACLYFDGRHWTLPGGACFGAYASALHKRTVGPNGQGSL